MKHTEAVYEVFDSIKHLESLLKEVERLRNIEEKYSYVENRLRDYKDAAIDLGVHSKILNKIKETELPF